MVIINNGKDGIFFKCVLFIKYIILPTFHKNNTNRKVCQFKIIPFYDCDICEIIIILNLYLNCVEFY